MTKTLLFSLCLMAATTLNAQTFQWAKSFGTTTDESGNAITTDASGNVLTTGFFQGTVDFDPGTGTANLTSLGGEDVFVQKMDSSGNFVWAKSFGGVNNDEVFSIATDASGDVYTLGYFTGTVDFDPGAGTYNLSSAGSYDVFIEKLDASGHFVWAKSFGGTNFDYGSSLTVDANGNIYSIGRFSGTVDFDPGIGTFNLTSGGLDDVFIEKLDASGSFVWAKSFGGVSNEMGSSIAVDATGNIYATGRFDGTTDFDPGAGTTNLTTEGNFDIFIEKLDASGNFVWAKSFGGTGDDESYSNTIDASGNSIITGYFTGTVDFDPGAGTTNLTAVGADDIFIEKLDASGNFVWAKSFGGVSGDYGESVTTDAIGNIYATGFYQDVVDFDPGTGVNSITSAGVWDIFIEKLDATGNYVWAKSLGGLDYDKGNSITVTTSGSIYTIGNFGYIADFDPGTGVFNLTSAGGQDVFVQKMSQTTTGLAMPVSNIKISVSPNPTKGMIQISFAQGLSKAELIITDLLGKEIFTKTYNNLLNTNIEVDGASGLYFLTIKTPDGQSTVKLVKE